MKTILPLIAIFITCRCYAQDTKLEESIFSVQAGFFGVFVNNEYAVSKKIALRSEIGYELIGYAYSEALGSSYKMMPVFTFEPRWYYNLTRRENKGKNITANSGNFVGIKTSFNPNVLTISKDELEYSLITMIPTWGLRRKMGKHFNFETGFGIGGGYLFYKDAVYQDYLYLAINLHLRFGYNFFIGSK